MIYNQGFELIIQGRKFFAFSLYKQSGKTVESFCHLAFPGWVHDSDGRNWGCYEGEKRVTQSEKHLLKKVTHQHLDDTGLFKMSKSFIEGRCQFASRCFSEHAFIELVSDYPSQRWIAYQNR